MSNGTLLWKIFWRYKFFLVCVISARDESVDVVVLRFLQSFCNIIISLDNRGSIAVI